MKTYLLVMGVCSILIAQAIYPNNEPENNNPQILKQIYDGLSCAGKKCAKCIGAACTFLIDHGKAQAQAEQLPGLKEALTNEQKDRKETQAQLNKTQEESQKHDREIIKNLTTHSTLEQAEKVANIATAGVVVTGAAYSAYKAIRDRSSPTEEQMLHKERVKFELEKLKAERAIRRCLAYNDEGEMDSEGMPRICREELKAFIAVASPQEIQATKDGFRNR